MIPNSSEKKYTTFKKNETVLRENFMELVTATIQKEKHFDTFLDNFGDCISFLFSHSHITYLMHFFYGLFRIIVCKQLHTLQGAKWNVLFLCNFLQKKVGGILRKHNFTNFGPL